MDPIEVEVAMWCDSPRNYHKFKKGVRAYLTAATGKRLGSTWRVCVEGRGAPRLVGERARTMPKPGRRGYFISLPSSMRIVVGYDWAFKWMQENVK